MSALEDELLGQILAAGLPEPVREHRFHPIRRWRFDLAWPDVKLAVEVDGGSWIAGNHTRGAGFEQNIVKLNSAAALGWVVLRFTGNLIKHGGAVTTIAHMLELRSKQGG